MGNLLLLLCTIAASADDDVTLERIDPRGVAGSLVICGGGTLPDAVMDRFVDLAGGEESRLVVIPTASERADEASEESLLASWKGRKLASVGLLHTRSRGEADEPDFVAPLSSATAVWFGGGAQSRLSEAYVGTAVERELQALLHRGDRRHFGRCCDPITFDDCQRESRSEHWRWFGPPARGGYRSTFPQEKS